MFFHHIFFFWINGFIIIIIETHLYQRVVRKNIIVVTTIIIGGWFSIVIMIIITRCVRFAPRRDAYLLVRFDENSKSIILFENNDYRLYGFAQLRSRFLIAFSICFYFDNVCNKNKVLAASWTNTVNGSRDSLRAQWEYPPDTVMPTIFAYILLRWILSF